MAINKKDDLEKNKVDNKISGVDDATANKMNSTFNASNDQQSAQNKSNGALSNVEGLTNKKNIISGSVMNTLNSTFTKPTAVQEADVYIASQLSKIQSGKTSYTDQVKNIMAQIQGREKFSYDVDADPLFQQALASAMSSGKQAMQDTIGQASSLTGGYGSTYATTAGNQAYNSFIEDAYDNLPQYYQMAMEAYQMEGDELYRQLGMFTDADDREYNRNVTAYDATYQHRNRMYDESYQLFRDAKTDAYNMANLQLSEHGQLVSDAVNYYNVTSDYANTMYNREYTKWNDEVNQAMKYAQMLNSDYWSQTNFDEGVRQYEQNFAEEQRQFNESYNQTEKWNQKDLDYKYSALAQDQSQFNATMEYNKSKQGETKEGYVEREDGTYKEATESQMRKALEAYEEGGEAGYKKYIESLPSNVDVEGIDEYVTKHNKWDNWEMSEDTKNRNNWFVPGNDDMNDKYTFGSETKTFGELKKEIENSGLSQKEKDALLKKLREQSKK